MFQTVLSTFIVLVLFGVFGAQPAFAQWHRTLVDSNRLSVGFHLVNYRDLLNTRLDRQEFGYDGRDMSAMIGDHTRIDLGLGMDVVYFINPTFSLEYSRNKGMMTGGNKNQYYESDVSFKGLGLNIAWRNLINKPPRKLVPYLRLGWDRASYSSTRYFEKEPDIPCYQGEERTLSGVVNRLSIGVGSRYHINNQWHFFGTISYASVATDAWDGFNYAYGSMRGRDDMLHTQIGLRFTLGKSQHMDLKGQERFDGGINQNKYIDSVLELSSKNVDHYRRLADSLESHSLRVRRINQDSIENFRDDLRKAEADLRQKEALLAEVERQKQEEKAAAQKVRDDLNKALEAYAKLGIVVS